MSLACGQTFPNGVGDLLAQLNSKLGGVDGMRADNSAALHALSKAAAADAAAAAEQQREADTLQDAVFAAAHRAVAELKYVGGCARIMPAIVALSTSTTTSPSGSVARSSSHWLRTPMMRLVGASIISIQIDLGHSGMTGKSKRKGYSRQRKASVSTTRG